MRKIIGLAVCFGLSFGLSIDQRVAVAAPGHGRCPYCASETCKRGSDGSATCSITTSGCSEYGLCFDL